MLLTQMSSCQKHYSFQVTKVWQLRERGQRTSEQAFRLQFVQHFSKIHYPSLLQSQGKLIVLVYDLLAKVELQKYRQLPSLPSLRVELQLGSILMTAMLNFIKNWNALSTSEFILRLFWQCLMDIRLKYTSSQLSQMRWWSLPFYFCLASKDSTSQSSSFQATQGAFLLLMVMSERERWDRKYFPLRMISLQLLLSKFWGFQLLTMVRKEDLLDGSSYGHYAGDVFTSKYFIWSLRADEAYCLKTGQVNFNGLLQRYLVIQKRRGSGKR